MTIKADIALARPDFRLEARLDMPPGITGVMGPSGAGKSTLALAIAGLARPDRGRIEVDGTAVFDSAEGVDVPPHRRRVGVVFQDDRLFPHMTVARNLSYGQPRGPGAEAERTRVTRLLGIEGLLHRGPAKLSGGERQRVAIGRALLSRPRLLVMDEPLSALDPARKAEILPYLERLRGEDGLSILYVSHAAGEIARLADHVALLDAGHITLSGPVGTVFADARAGSVGGGAVLMGRIARHDTVDDLTEVSLGSQTLRIARREEAVGTPVRIRIDAGDVLIALKRPESISALNMLDAEVREVSDGSHGSVLVSLVVGGDRLLSRLTRRSARELGLTPGTKCVAILKSTRVAPEDIGR